MVKVLEVLGRVNGVVLVLKPDPVDEVLEVMEDIEPVLEGDVVILEVTVFLLSLDVGKGVDVVDDGTEIPVVTDTVGVEITEVVV